VINFKATHFTLRLSYWEKKNKAETLPGAKHTTQSTKSTLQPLFQTSLQTTPGWQRRPLALWNPAAKYCNCTKLLPAAREGGWSRLAFSSCSFATCWWPSPKASTLAARRVFKMSPPDSHL